MINLDQIEAWIHEAEQRPSSAPLIIQYIAKRLAELSKRNEALLAENIELRTEKKVEEYESRIANLEYQLDLLKRQLGGELTLSMLTPTAETISVILYTTKGRVLRIEQSIEQLVSGNRLTRLAEMPAGGAPRLLVTTPTEELLFVFDSGRTTAVPVTELTAQNPETLDWKQAYLAEPRGGEELATVLPVARMTLYDYCVQTSRRGCAKKMMKTAFESHVAKNFVGSGVKGKPDRTCNLTFTGKDDCLVLATREGYLLAVDISQLPYTIEEVLKLGPTDYIAASFVVGSKPSVLLVTGSGKVVHRESTWLEKANSFKSRGQPVYSQARREAGVRVVGAAAVDPEDWCLSLTEAGELTLHSAADLINRGAITTEGSSPDEERKIVEFTSFSAPKNAKP